MSLNHAKNYVDDDRISIKNEDSLFNQCGNDGFVQQQNNQNHLLYESLLASKQQQLHHQQHSNSTVDISAIEIDPIIVNYGLMSMHRETTAATDSGCADSDSLLSDIDMMT